MTKFLTNTIKGLSLGLIVAFALLAASDASATPARAAVPAVHLLLDKIEAAVVIDTRCRHKPKKRHCKHAGRLTATAIEAGTKRKATKPATAHLAITIAAHVPEATIHRSDGQHLRSSYGGIYAATRRMHI